MNDAERFIRGLSICLCLSATAFAQEPSPELRVGGQLYLHSVGLPKEAQVCERYIPGYRSLFDPLYDSWKERHKELMDRAQQLMREAAEKEGRQFEPIVAEVTDNAAATLARAHLGVLLVPAARSAQNDLARSRQLAPRGLPPEVAWPDQC